MMVDRVIRSLQAVLWPAEVPVRVEAVKGRYVYERACLLARTFC